MEYTLSEKPIHLVRNGLAGQNACMVFIVAKDFDRPLLRARDKLAGQ